MYKTSQRPCELLTSLLLAMQALRQAFSSHGRLSSPHPNNPHPNNNLLMDTAQNLFSKGFKNLNSVKYALQGKVCPDSCMLTGICAVRTCLTEHWRQLDFICEKSCWTSSALRYTCA